MNFTDLSPFTDEDYERESHANNATLRGTMSAISSAFMYE